MVVVRSIMYVDGPSIASLIGSYALNGIILMFHCACFYLAFSWVGFKYLQAELPRKGNEQLLHNLVEGIFIVDEETSQVQFCNTAASSINQ